MLLAAPARSQSNTATLAGRVVDPQGAAIPAATITVRNTDVASSRTLTSSSDGSFRVAGLIPGAYTVEARSGSLHTRTPVRLTLTLGSSTEITLHLVVAAVKQSTTVTARRGTVEGNTIAPPPNTAEASVGSFLPGLTVTYLPNRDRDFTQFTNQAAATADDSDGTGVSIAGQRSRALAVQVDGTSFLDPLLGGRRGAEDGAILIPLSAVREFQVLHSGVDASVGDTGAGFISVATKSGANRARGDAFYTGRPPQFTSADAFGNSLDSVQNAFGFGYGSPIRKDKVFYFASVEQDFVHAPYYVQFAPQSPGTSVPDALATQQGQIIESQSPTTVFLRLDAIRSHHATPSMRSSATTARAAATRRTTAPDSLGLLTRSASPADSAARASPRASASAPSSTTTPSAPSSSPGPATIATAHPIPSRPNNSSTASAPSAETPPASTSTRPSNCSSAKTSRSPADATSSPSADVSQSTPPTSSRSRTSTAASTTTPSPTSSTTRHAASSRPSSLATSATAAPSTSSPSTPIYARNCGPISSLTTGLRWAGQWNPQPGTANPALAVTQHIPNDLTQWQPRAALAWDVSPKTVVRASAGLFASPTPATFFHRVFADNGTQTITADSYFDPSLLTLAGGNTSSPHALPAPPPGLTTPHALVAGICTHLPQSALARVCPQPRSPRLLQSSSSPRATSIPAPGGSNSGSTKTSSLPSHLHPPALLSFASSRPIAGVGRLLVEQSTAHSNYQRRLHQPQRSHLSPHHSSGKLHALTHRRTTTPAPARTAPSPPSIPSISPQSAPTRCSISARPST